jgi:Family of unknown function (DUF6885)
MASPNTPADVLDDRAGRFEAEQVRLTLLPSAAQLLELHAAELPQKDDLCGAFWGMLVLRAAGHALAGEPPEPIDQDAVGLASGTTVSREPQPRSLPPGEPGRRDYRVALPIADDATRSGTSARALARAVGELSGGAIEVVPVAGPWDPSTVRALVELARDPAVLGVVANVATGELWASRPDPLALLRHVTTGELDGPRSEWSVGHFVAILGSIEGPAGALLLLADTYRSLGWAGIHAQPVDRVAAALRRDGDNAGGVLLMTVAGATQAMTDRLLSLGLQVDHWDNGSDDAARR